MICPRKNESFVIESIGFEDIDVTFAQDFKSKNLSISFPPNLINLRSFPTMNQNILFICTILGYLEYHIPFVSVSQ